MNKKIASEIAIGIILIVSIIFAASFLFSGENDSAPNNPKEAVQNQTAVNQQVDFSLELIHDNGMKESRSIFYLNNKGDARYQYQQDDKVLTDQRAIIPEREMERLKNAISQADILALKDSYDCGESGNCVYDYAKELKIEIGGIKKDISISILDDDLPATLGAILKELDALSSKVEGGIFDSVMVACPMDAKQCPDGSYVSRVAPSCEFAQCPDSKTSKEHTYLTHIMGEKSSIFIECTKNEDCQLIDLEQGCRNFSSININNTQQEILKYREREKELLKDVTFDCDANSEIKIEEASPICQTGSCSYVKTLENNFENSYPGSI